MTTTTPSTSQFPVPSSVDTPEDVHARILEVQEKSGFVPNVFLAPSHRSDECRVFFAYHSALMLREDSSLVKGEREMTVAATSTASQYLYCVVVHGVVLRIYEKNPLMANQVAVSYRKADITPRQRTMFDFAVKVYTTSYTVSGVDYETLCVHGFDDEDI